MTDVDEMRSMLIEITCGNDDLIVNLSLPSKFVKLL